MQIKNTHERFGVVSKTFHWLIFILITLQFYLIWTFESMLKINPARGTYMFFHKSVGLTILLVAIAWIIWRRFNVLPTPLPNQYSWQHYLAKTTHILLLIGIVAMPLTGIVMGMAAGRSLDWFGIYTITPFSFVPHNDVLAGRLKLTHEIIATALVGLVILHTLGALVHHFIYKDNVLRRMLPFGK